MSYTVDYSQLSGKAKRNAALEDVRTFLGETLYEKVCELIRTSTDTPEQCANALAFVGVRGYPAQAMVEAFHPKGQ